ncbi:capsular polysaccharide biosynthesis protein CapF [Spirochaeta dissipatitropha]
MRILVTGAYGFIGKNLVSELKNRNFTTIYQFDKETDIMLLDEYCAKADFVYHLAGVNRPEKQEEFMKGNFGFTSILLDNLKKKNNTCPVLLSSSVHAELDNPYGQSKKAGEQLLFDYSKETGAPVYVYRFPNVFGKWCLPNYNSAVATFCHNIARGLPVQINDSKTLLKLVYIDDLVNELINVMGGSGKKVGEYYEVPVVHTITIGEIVDLLNDFNDSRINKTIPDMENSFTKKIYSTYLSYLPEDSFSYPLHMNVDHRGSFTEFIKTKDRGQVSINISKPGIVKGNHWHHTKNEKFLVVSGTGVIRFRNIGCKNIIEYYVSGEKLEVVDIPVGYTHNIENLGDTDMVTVMWVNEVFNPSSPDTFFLEV